MRRPALWQSVRMAQFSGGEAVWIAKLGNLRNTIRQEVIARQLHQHLGHRRSVLDVGCGQGTQALRLLQRGCSVVGVEPSLALIELFSNDARKLELSPDIRHGGIDDLDAVLGSSRFDAVCAHGS